MWKILLRKVATCSWGKGIEESVTFGENVGCVAQHTPKGWESCHKWLHRSEHAWVPGQKGKKKPCTNDSNGTSKCRMSRVTSESHYDEQKCPTAHLDGHYNTGAGNSWILWMCTRYKFVMTFPPSVSTNIKSHIKPISLMWKCLDSCWYMVPPSAVV